MEQKKIWTTLLDVCCNLSLVLWYLFCDYSDYTKKYLEIKASLVNYIFIPVYGTLSF